MRYIELLAPARTADIGIEAIRHGADAVYIGGPAFGARQAACNSIDDIKRLVEYARPFRVRIYVTVNTLLRHDERRIVQALIWQLYDIGVSAIIIQDPCILGMELPPIALHASTQMDNRTPERVKELQAAGFEQVVLARELDTAQIAAIHQAVPDMPLEVFVHGALCVGLSGRCYASEHLLGRSANRGECAQVCRLKFDLEDEHGHVLIHDRHLLSLKDMNRSQHIAELLDAGVTSFKIEGRLKDMAYVKNITAYYSQLIDGIVRQHPDRYARASLGQVALQFTPHPARSFNRGFTSYLTTDDIFQPLTPKAIGEYIGTARCVGRDYIEAGNDIVAGDGLCYFDRNGQLKGFRANRVDRDRIFPRPMPRDLGTGTALYRNQDQTFDRQMAASSAERTIPIDISITDTPAGFRLSAGKVSIETEYKHEPAHTSQHENIVRQLSRLGGTPYRAENVTVAMSGNWFIPSSLLADWRRELISAVANATDCASNGIGIRERDKAAVPTAIHDDGHVTLMQCRHCLRRELGACPHGKRPAQQLLTPSMPVTPATQLFLRMSDGRRMRLAFDCARCMMKILSS